MAHAIRRPAALLAASFLLTASGSFAYDCDHTAPRDEVIDAAGAERIEIDASAGFLKVHGSEGASEIRVSGEACASSESLLEDIRLEVRRSGDRVRIVAEIPESRWGRSTAKLDLTIEVPSSVELEIDDGSGEIEVRNVGSTTIDDGSGEIEVSEVAGDLEIDDGSGEIEVTGVTGQVRIDDGSGEINLRTVGSVVIDDDGSGEIDIEEVFGDVMVRSDGFRFHNRPRRRRRLHRPPGRLRRHKTRRHRRPRRRAAGQELSRSFRLSLEQGETSPARRVRALPRSPLDRPSQPNG